MYKVCFVDDEVINHKLLENLVDWQALGFVIAGTATDGVEALELAQQVHPDLMFLDIKMPRMDGMECIRRLREIDTGMQIVLVTAFSEFEYAQKAIAYQVTEYLLKPVGRADINAVTEKVKKLLDERGQKPGSGSLQKEYRQSRLSLLLQQALQETHAGNLQQEAVYEDLLHEPVSIFDFYLYEASGKKADSSVRKLFQEELQQIFHRAGIEIYCVVPYKNERLLVMTAVVSEKDAVFASALQYARHQQHELDCYSFHHAFHRYNWKTCLAQLAEAARAGFYRSEGSVYYYEYLAPFSAAQTIQESVDGIISGSFEQLDDLALLSYLDRKFVWAAEDRIRPAVLVDFCINLLVALKLKLKDSFSFDTFPILRCIDLEELQGVQKTCRLQYLMNSWIADMFVQLRQQMQTVSKGQALVIQANAFAKNHFGRSAFSVMEVASAVGLSKNYFVTVYKEETGENFWDYVTVLRMDEAKRLLATTDYTNAVISQMVGYESEYHFLRKFKKLVGQTPNQYRKNR